MTIVNHHSYCKAGVSMKYLILLDFGSTFTKGAVLSVADQKIVYTTKAPSTVNTDGAIGLSHCLGNIRQQIGKTETAKAKRLASSSAAGGLRMAVCGLTKSLSIAAGRNVSFGAGAKILHVAAGPLTDDNLACIVKSRVEIILLCGGYEGGNERLLLKNAEKLAASQIACPIIYGGNSLIAQKVQILMRQGNKECFLVPNIIPDVGKLNSRGAEDTIRSLFMQRIVNMKGLDKVRQETGGILMPTPAAVLQAGELLALGARGCPGMGDLMIVDVGGATTDIHSYAEHKAFEGAHCLGAPEPYAKRTVEGDLGMRESADALCHEVGFMNLAAYLGIPEEYLQSSIARRLKDTGYLPDTNREMMIDQAIAYFAIRLGARRHCGRIEGTVSINCNRLQTGKNLTKVQTIVGTGGEIINSRNPAELLKGILACRQEEPDTLLPEKAAMYVDSEYILYAAGLLRSYDENLAYGALRNSIKRW